MTSQTKKFESSSSSSPEHATELLAKLREFVERELSKMDALIIPLLELRHQLFDVDGTDYTKDMPIVDQLYADPSNNIDFVAHDLGLRGGNALDYHQTTEKYDKGHSVEHAERDFAYRQAILRVAQDLGFVAKIPGVATNQVDQTLGILDSELEPIDEKVAAVVINGAAAMSNVKRVRDTIRNIESGAIVTDRIILTAGTRPVDHSEKGRMTPPYRAGDTEFESLKLAAEDLLGVHFEDSTQTIPVEYGDDLTARVQTATASIGGRVITIEAVEAPYDERRTMADGRSARRVNTEEVFLATLPLLENLQGAIVMQSHDTWTPWQNLIGHQVFGLAQGRSVYPAGPLNDDRVYWSGEDGERVMDIKAPQDVIDEIVKTYRQLVQLQTALQTK